MVPCRAPDPNTRPPSPVKAMKLLPDSGVTRDDLADNISSSWRCGAPTNEVAIIVDSRIGAEDRLDASPCAP